MKLSDRVQFMLWACLIILNIIMRYPSTPHEIGRDSFEIHILANSISTFGHAKWWVNSLSIFGFYPLSYASTVPFILSGVSQSTGTNMEWVIWLFGVIIGLFSAFTAYLLAGAIKNDDLFKFLVALVFSTSQGILTLTTWTASTRGFLVVLLPLFIYSLLKCRTSMLRYGVLTIILFVIMGATHNLIYYVIPIIMSYFIVTAFYKLGKYIKSIRIPENFANIILLASFFVIFMIPFFSRALWVTDPETMRTGIGSRYMLMFSMLGTYGRYVGILIVFVVGGYTYLLLKRNKIFEEWFLLLVLVGLAPFLYASTYMKWFILPFVFLLIGIGLTNVAKIYKQKKRYISILIVILLLLSTSFSGYYQFLHFLINPPPYDRYMEESTYIGALWIKGNINKNLFYNDDFVGRRIFAISEVPTLWGGAIGLTYGFYKDITDISISENSPLSVAFYMDGPYVKTPLTPYIEGNIYYSSISRIDSLWGKRLIHKYNLSYVIENEYIGDNVFISSIRQTENNIYDDGKIRIWVLT